MLFPSYVVDAEFPVDHGATVEEDGMVVESGRYLLLCSLMAWSFM